MVLAFNDNVMINMNVSNDWFFLCADNNQHHNKCCFPHWDSNQLNNKWICWAQHFLLWWQINMKLDFMLRRLWMGLRIYKCPQFLSHSRIIFVMNIIHLHSAAAYSSLMTETADFKHTSRNHVSTESRAESIRPIADRHGRLKEATKSGAHWLWAVWDTSASFPVSLLVSNVSLASNFNRVFKNRKVSSFRVWSVVSVGFYLQYGRKWLQITALSAFYGHFTNITGRTAALLDEDVGPLGAMGNTPRPPTGQMGNNREVWKSDWRWL